MFALSSGISVTAVVSVMLPLLEYTFKVTTDISLLELLDMEQPLMKNLMITAPGTYHHSVIVGNLVESAAEAVGVNPLLARVSSYYHDIGKIKMPEYFVENQSNSLGKHEEGTCCNCPGECRWRSAVTVICWFWADGMVSSPARR